MYKFSINELFFRMQRLQRMISAKRLQQRNDNEVCDICQECCCHFRALANEVSSCNEKNQQRSTLVQCRTPIIAIKTLIGHWHNSNLMMTTTANYSANVAISVSNQ